MDLRVDPASVIPPARQLVEGVLDELASGRLGSGARLPSVRALAAEALVNPNTVGKAYKELEGLGVVRGRNGSGVYVEEAGPRIAVGMRREQTLLAFLEAAETALRAGHRSGELRDALQGYLEGIEDGGDRR